MTKLLFAFFFLFVGIIPTHNFYVSTTSIRYVPEEKVLQITIQVFLDDFEAVLQQSGNKNIKLNPADSQEEIDQEVADYFQKKLLFKALGETINFDFLGKVYKNDLLVAYLELKVDSPLTQLHIKNNFFYEYLPDQKNIIHLKVASKRKSFLAISNKSEFEVPDDFFDFKD
jgi:hypothetical protein